MIKTADILKKAKALSAAAAPLDTSVKNRAIGIMADELENSAEEILKANAKDVKNASGKISDVMLDRLRLDSARIKAMADGMRAVAVLPDPVGRVLSETKRENGLDIKKVSVPLGVVAIIYESRPNVTSDAAVLCFKSGNVCVLRSGKEAFLSASAVVSALKRGLKAADLSEDYINLVEDTSRGSANELMTATGLVDLLIPRGGKGLISACVENATVPCIETGTGICHIYVDKSADTDMAVNVVDNAKASRPSVCNAAEVCLVHRDIAAEFLPKLAKRFKDRVELRGDKEVCGIINAVPAGENDFDTEFLDYIMAVAIVDSTEEAVRHIGRHSTHHSESIITNDSAAADYFTARVDSAAVYVNASTRFTDGGEFGLGCEMGISTQKLHARGPMGLCELNTYKYIISGNGQIR
ncbi:MAG TPA: glutamate-5-semialdehyde dehydrogenase [Ruminococcaceae bacterium]|nr:glutamate-5-semialdehyde dehydrogenase [Oscillospiraceae bacterium]